MQPSKLKRLEAYCAEFAAQVHPIYVHLGLQWGGTEGKYVPSEAELAGVAVRLMEDMLEAGKESLAMGLGRLEVRRDEGGLALRFVFEAEEH